MGTRAFFISCCIVSLLLLAPFSSVQAAAGAGATGTRGTAYLVMLDQSSSMWLADPGGRRIAIAKALIERIPDRDRLQIVEFSSEARELFLGWIVIDGPTRERVKAQLEGRSLSSRDATDINAALAKGLELIGELEPGLKPVVLLISDGRATTGSKGTLLTILSIYAAKQIPIYTFGLGILPSALLKTISKEAGPQGRYMNASRPWAAVEEALSAIVARHSPRVEAPAVPLDTELGPKLKLALTLPSQIWEDDPLTLRATVLYSGQPLKPRSNLRLNLSNETEAEFEVEGLRVQATITPEEGGESQTLILSFNPSLNAYQGELRGLNPGEYRIRVVAWGALSPHSALPGSGDQKAPFKLASPERTLVVRAVPAVGLRFRPPGAVGTGTAKEAVLVRNQPIVIELVGIGPDGPYELSPPPQEAVAVVVEVEGPTPHSTRTLTLKRGEGIASFPEEGDYRITLSPGRHYKVAEIEAEAEGLLLRVVPPLLNIEPRKLLFEGKASPSPSPSSLPLKLSLRSTLYPPDIAVLKIEGVDAPLTIEPHELTLSPNHPEAELTLRPARAQMTFTPWERLLRRERTFKINIIDVNDVYPWETQEIPVRMAPPPPWPEIFAGLALLSGVWVLTTGMRGRGQLREGEEIPLEKGSLTIGSGRDCDLVIPHPNISAKHFAVEVGVEKATLGREGIPTPALTVKDLGGGVRVLHDGELHKVIAHQRVQPGDVIIVGRDEGDFHFQVITKGGQPGLRAKKVSYPSDRLALKAAIFLGLTAVAAALYLSHLL